MSLLGSAASLHVDIRVYVLFSSHPVVNHISSFNSQKKASAKITQNTFLFLFNPCKLIGSLIVLLLSTSRLTHNAQAQHDERKDRLMCAFVFKKKP